MRCAPLGWVEVDGEGFGAWHCPSLWAAAVRLVELSNSDEDVREVATLAQALRRANPDDMHFAAAVVDLVQGAVPYVPDPTGWPLRSELFRSPLSALRRGGDCDDHSRLVKALARGGGLRAAMWFLGTDEEPSHVVCKLLVGPTWWWSETTLPAWLGEHPYDALGRVGARDRL